jgi:hypothetical protein
VIGQMLCAWSRYGQTSPTEGKDGIRALARSCDK